MNTKNMSEPTVISDAILKIITSKKPKTRYAVGYMAKQVLWLRHLLSDRLFERIIVLA